MALPNLGIATSTLMPATIRRTSKLLTDGNDNLRHLEEIDNRGDRDAVWTRDCSRFWGRGRTVKFGAKLDHIPFSSSTARS
jgi:hypothetical protein